MGQTSKGPMMKSLLALSALFISFASSATVIIKEEVYVPKQSPAVIAEMISTGSVIVDHVTSEGFEVYGGTGLMDYLESKNILYMNMKQLNLKNFDDYPSHKEIGEKLEAAARKNPSIMKLMSIGKSVKGKELWVMKISDNVNVDEVEPEFKYISSMHGDEITGREMTVSMIEEMAEKYGKDKEITELVNNTEIYIMPSMNPDGSELKQRANAKGIDLNRNFPDIISDRESKLEGRQIENQAVMKFQASRRFSLSANFHGGTIVANYPWDSKYDLHPLNDFAIELSKDYAELNPDMHSSSEFKDGITNGAAWYVVRGGMQDWSYFWHDDLQITLEVSHTKYPRYADIPGFYRSNRDSMFNFMKQVHMGGGFKFARKNVSGTVRIKQTSPVVKDLGSYAFSGSEFYKVLPEGQYTFTVDADEATQDVSIVSSKNQIAKDGNYTLLE
jgi:hypothetical protein